MTELTVLRVFIGPDDDGGNLLGVFLDGPIIPEDRRQSVAAELRFSETVYVDDAAEGAIRIFTPGRELPFAGHPTVGTAWLFHETGAPATTLRSLRRSPTNTRKPTSMLGCPPASGSRATP